MKYVLHMKYVIRALSLLGMTVFLAGCYPAQPKDTQNICNIFQEYPEWYADAKQTQQKWGVPVGVQMAIIYQESGFQATAEPLTRNEGRFKNIIPWHRQSSALGYCQALVNTWGCYEKSEGQDKSRDEFADASDFIGWYANQAQQIAHIQPTDAYNLYLAYHEGLGGYHTHSFWKKPWLVHIAHKVQERAMTYTDQLSQCAGDIPVVPAATTPPVNTTPSTTPGNTTPTSSSVGPTSLQSIIENSLPTGFVFIQP